MRLGVLDVGSNTVHLLVVDAHRGGHPNPTTSEKTQLRLAEHLDEAGDLTPAGAVALVQAVSRAKAAAAVAGCDELLSFATSALRDAGNSVAVLQRVRAETGVALRMLPGEDEARYTFLAVRRWYGWSAGRLLVLDIGGGSLELAAGRDEDPEVAESLPLGAGRLNRRWFSTDPPSRAEIVALAEHVDAELAPVSERVLERGEFELAVATSKTFRSLARLTGAAPSAAGLRTRRIRRPGRGCGLRARLIAGCDVGSAEHGRYAAWPAAHRGQVDRESHEHVPGKRLWLPGRAPLGVVGC
jgi:exopolyphosphatase / guanosine-5'-triphosphate,3'-diphosphate pyrophosphatase